MRHRCTVRAVLPACAPAPAGCSGTGDGGDAAGPPPPGRPVVHGTGGRARNTAFRADLAEAAARVLAEDHHLGRAYDFTGPRWTYPRLAEVLSSVSGTPVIARGRTGRAPGAHGWLEDQVRSGALERRSDDLHQVLGHPPTSLEQTVTALLS